jgi:outer membrane protein assembly factor BamD
MEAVLFNLRKVHTMGNSREIPRLHEKKTFQDSLFPVFLWGLSLLLVSCSKKEKPYLEQSVTKLYSSGYEKLKQEDFMEASEDFDELDRQHPHSPWAPKAQMLSAYALFKAQKFEESIAVLETLISVHPSFEYIDYVYYLRALCYYRDIPSIYRDSRNAELCLDALDSILKKFPHSPYSEDAQFKKDFVLSHLAAKEMDIGRYYLKNKNFVAALNRFIDVPNKYPTSSMIPEALYRMLECQIAMGLITDARKTYRILCYNYSKSLWASQAKGVFQDCGIQL